MRFEAIIESGVCWIVNDDDKKLFYLEPEEVSELKASLSFVEQELDMIDGTGEHGGDDWMTGHERDAQ